MKNKALTYILLIAVGFIWYKVFFRIKDNLTGENEQVVASNQQLGTFRIASRDTVELQLNYRDPFGAEKRVSQVLASADELPHQRQPSPRRPPKPQFVWPKVEYYGLIRNRDSKHPLALVRADGLIYNLRRGDELFNDIYIKSIAPDSVTVGFKKLDKTFYRK